MRRGPRKEPIRRDLSRLDARPLLTSRVAGGTKRVFNRGRPRGYLNRMRVKPKSAIIQKLQRAGIFIPRIIEMDPSNGLMHFENGNKTVTYRLRRLNPTQNSSQRKLVQALISKCARTIGRVQAEGVTHRHPHLNNFVVSGNRVGLIDFKRAETVSPNIWSSAGKIFGAFETDYSYFYAWWPDWLRSVSGPWQEFVAKTAWQQMVRPYPCSPEIKKQLVQRLQKAQDAFELLSLLG